MPPAIPLIAAVAGAAATSEAIFGATILGSALLATVANSLFGFVVSTALSTLGSGLLSKKSGSQDFSQAASGRTLMVRSSVDSHKILYGQVKVSGPLVFAKTVNTGPSAGGTILTGTNKFLHLVIPLAGHEVDSVPEIYLDNNLLTIDAPTNMVTSAPYAQGIENTTKTVATISSATCDQYRGVVTINTTAAHGISVGNNVTIAGVSDPTYNGSFPVTAVPTGTSFTYTFRTSKTSATGGHVTRAVVTTITKGYVRVKVHLGSPDQIADSQLCNECGLTTDHRLQGIAYLYIRLEYSADVFPLGIPNVSAVVNGKKVFDPRTGLTAWSDNWALCVRDYMTSDYGFDCLSDEINDDFFIAAANISDELVPTTGAATQKRYLCNGVVDTAGPPLDNLSQLLTGGGGAVTYVQGEFRLHAGAYDNPVGDIGIDQLAGPVKITARVARQSLFNAVKGTFVDPTQSWQPVDFPFVTNPQYTADDGGDTIFTDIDLPFTTDIIAAQRICKMALDRSRQGIIVEMPVNHSALQYAVYDVVTLTNAQMGWSAKPFRIMKWSTAAGQAITLTLQEEASASYDWNSGTAIVNDPAPDTNLPTPSQVEAPGTPVVTENLYVTRDNAVKDQAIVSWDDSQDAFLLSYTLQYKISAASDWITLPPVLDPTVTIQDIAPGIYDFRVKAVNTLGVSSAWMQAAPLTIYGLTALPDDITGFSLTMFSSLAYLSWDPLILPFNLDVAIGGNIEIRHTEDTTSAAAWNSSNLIANNILGSATNATVPLKPGSYLVKAKDSTGNYSANAVTISTLAGTLATFTNGTLIEEDPNFPGAFPNVPTYSSSFGVIFDPAIPGLKIAGNDDFDSIPDLDGLVQDLDSWGGVSTNGKVVNNLAAFYAFSAGFNFGSVVKVRLTTILDTLCFNVLDDFDARPGNMDTWLDFDGLEGAPCSVAIALSYSKDNVEYHKVEFATTVELECQYANTILLVIRNTDPQYNMYITRLGLQAATATM